MSAIDSSASQTADARPPFRRPITEPPPGDGQPSVTTVAATALTPARFNVMSRGQPKPDMFAPGRDVIVEGLLTGDSTLQARQVLTSCPSKYSPKQN